MQNYNVSTIEGLFADFLSVLSENYDTDWGVRDIWVDTKKAENLESTLSLPFNEMLILFKMYYSYCV